MRFNQLVPELSVSDIEKSKRFYTDVLRFRIEYERVEDKFAFLSLGSWESAFFQIPTSAIESPNSAAAFL